MLSPASPFVTLIHMHICTWWCISSDNYFASIDSISLDAVVCWGTSKPRLLPTLISHVHMFWLVASPSIYCISGWSCYIVLTGFREYTDLSGEQNIPPLTLSLSERERGGGERARMRVCVCVISCLMREFCLGKFTGRFSPPRKASSTKYTAGT